MSHLREGYVPSNYSPHRRHWIRAVGIVLLFVLGCWLSLGVMYDRLEHQGRYWLGVYGIFVVAFSIGLLLQFVTGIKYGSGGRVVWTTYFCPSCSHKIHTYDINTGVCPYCEFPFRQADRSG